MKSVGQMVGALVLVVGLGVVIYSNTFQVPFVFDDRHVLLKRVPNEYSDIAIKDTLSGRRSLTYFTFALNYRFGDLEVAGYHAVNLILHLLSASTVFWLVWLLSCASTKKREYSLSGLVVSNHLLVALTASLLFVSHPLQTEGVTYVSQRTGLLAALLYLLTLATYSMWRLKRQWWWVLLAAGAAYLGIHAKETAFTIPVTLLLIELLFFYRRKQKTRYLVVMVWLLVIFSMPAYMFFIRPVDFSDIAVSQRYLNNIIPEQAHQAYGKEVVTRKDFLLTQLTVKVRYLRLMILPYGQSIDHGVRIVHSFFDMRTIAAGLALLALLASAIWLLVKKQLLMTLGIFWFFITLLPESSIYVLPEQMVEYRLYLPMAGLALVAAGLMQWLLGTRYWRDVSGVVGLITVLVVGMSVATYWRNGMWQDSLLLWTDAAAKAPDSTRPHTNRGIMLMEAGRFDEAEEAFERAVNINPQSAAAYVNLGVLSKRRGDDQGAITYYEQAIEVNPDDAAALTNLGLVYFDRQEWERAIPYFQRAVELDPKLAAAHNNLGAAYLEMKNYSAAEEHFRLSIDADAVYDLPLVNLGSLYIDLNEKAKAKELLEKAVSLNPKNSGAQALLRSIK